jgi:hypothetical protein
MNIVGHGPRATGHGLRAARAAFRLRVEAESP